MSNNYKTFTAPKSLGAEGEGFIKAWINHVPIEDGAVAQLKKVASMPFIYKHVAVMPDAHIGKGSTVGTVFASKSALIPAAVGVDLGCVDKETEFLSPSGWIKISDWNGEKVLQFNPYNQRADFVEPLNYIRKPATSFYHIKTKYGLDQMLSPDHKVMYRRNTKRGHWAGNIGTISAEEMVKKHEKNVLGWDGRFITTYRLNRDTRLEYSTAQLRVIIMVMADGHFPNKNDTCVVKVKKLRKVHRAMTILQLADIKYTHSIGEDECHSFRFKAPLKSKDMNDLWDASPIQLQTIAKESFFWDGNKEDNVFYTRIKGNADFMQYVYSSCGYRSRLLTDIRDSGIDYRVFANTNTEIGIKGSPKSKIKTIVAKDDDEQFCFTVPTGFWVMRRNGCVVVTGNCGMMAVKLSLKAEDLPDNLDALRSHIEALVPHGRTNNGKANVDRGARGTIDDYIADKWNTHLANKFDELKSQHQWLAKANSIQHLGTLGTGNHFIELCLDTEGYVWIMLHSGSRGVGNTIGTHFIEKAKKEMVRLGIKEALPDEDLAYLQQGTKVFDQYLEAVDWAQLFAKVNREIMMECTLQAVRDHIAKPFEIIEEAVNSHHNYVSKEIHYGDEVYVTRKGAVGAHKGQLGIIPGSMGAKSFIVRGLGNSESFCSCSHGAGRIMSRTAAKKLVTIEEHIRDTAGVNCKKDISVLDETPKAYKNIEDVMRSQEDLVEIVYTLKQVLCVKG